MQNLDELARREIIQNLSEKLKAHYVFPDVAVQICECLQRHFADGAYADVVEGELFALTLTDHLQSINQDEHLWVRWCQDPLPDDEGSLLQNEERLSGNVGVVDIRYFYRPSWGSGETAVSAMNFVAHTNALIIDLRQCRGGNPNMVALVNNYLFDGEPIHLNSLYWREEDFAQQYWTLPYVPGQRFVDKPIYVLTSPDTFSAGEEFAYNLQTRQRATLVGETTGGGAHPGSPYRLHPHFEVFIPVGCAINPITHDNWEGRGVIPDVSATQEDALTVAYCLALKSVIESIGEATDSPSKRLLSEAQAILAELQGT